MSVDAPEDYIITNDDINKILLLEENPLPFSELSKDNHFGATASSLKLIALLSYFGQLNSLRALFEADVEKNQLSELAGFEAHLYLCAARGYRSSEGATCFNDIQADWIIDGDQKKLTGRLQGASVIAAAIVVKYLCMWGHSAVATKVINELDPHVANCVLTHLLSISTLFGKGITRLPRGELRDRWHSFFESISKLLSIFSKKSIYHLNQNYIYFLSGAGNHEAAHALVKKYRTENPRLYSLVQMRKALSEKKVSKAIEFADRLIITKEPPDDISEQLAPFDRDVAEKALCEVNSLLRGAGIDVFIISGTLLGCVREGRIFEHDKDFDLGIIGWENQFNVAQALLSSPNFSFSAKGLKGHELFLLGVVHVPSGYSFDIFFFHDSGDKFKHGIQSRLGYTIHYMFSKFGLAEKEFLGQKFLIPDNYELFLDENYGKDWRTPDPNYFVKLESPALADKSGVNFAYSIRHEMLDMLGKRVAPEKGRIFVEKMKIHAQRKDQPKPSVVNAFLRKLVQWDEGLS
jgi:hypothetical protein